MYTWFSRISYCLLKLCDLRPLWLRGEVIIVLSAVFPDIVSVEGVTGISIEFFVGVLLGVVNEERPSPVRPIVDSASTGPSPHDPLALLL